MSTSSPRACTRPRPGQAGFTLIEILLVIVIIGVLAGLLLPAIGGAMRRAREATVNAEINQMAQALADFKNMYGDYPPSRILLVENGDYSSYISNSNPVSQLSGTAFPVYAPSGNNQDVTIGQLAQRSVLTLRKFWPRVSLNTISGGGVNLPSGFWYDFNGDNNLNGPWLLDGRACLAFFLGGIPTQFSQNGQTNFGVTGFARNPQNPFLNSMTTLASGSPNPMSSNNRTSPLFEFKAERLYPLDPTGTAINIIGYLDANSSSVGASPTNPPCYAYFSSYGGGGYDPNDVNMMENTDSGTGPVYLGYTLTFPPGSTFSPPPNPYTVSLTAGTGVTVVYQNAQSFQIISPGADSYYGVGGQYLPSGTTAMPVDTNNSMPSGDLTVRNYEFDNLTNFHNGRLQ